MSITTAADACCNNNDNNNHVVGASENGNDRQHPMTTNPNNHRRRGGGGDTSIAGDRADTRMNGPNPNMGDPLTHKTWKTLPEAKSNTDAVTLAVPYRNSSPDSACETDIPSPDQLGSPCLYAVESESSHVPSLMQDRELKLVPNIMHPIPPQTPVVVLNTTTTSPNANGLSPTWQQDSDGDSGITNFGERLGSTSSSEAEHSSSGLPDVYLARLQVKHLCRTGPRPVQLMNGFGPIRGDHSIPIAMKNTDTSHPPPAPATGSATGRIRPLDPATKNHNKWNVRYRASTPISVSFGLSATKHPSDDKEWLHQRSVSATEFHSPWKSGTSRRSSHELGTRPVSLDGEHLNRRTASQRFSSISHLQTNEPSTNRNGPVAQGKSLSSDGITLRRMSMSQQGKSALYVNVYENMSGSDSEGSVFHSDDLIKVRARPASVIPANSKPLPTTPRQAKSADAAVRRRRLQKAFSMACIVNYNDFIDVHARVASVIPVNGESDSEQKARSDSQRSCRDHVVNIEPPQEQQGNHKVNTSASLKLTNDDVTHHTYSIEMNSRLNLNQMCKQRLMPPHQLSHHRSMTKLLPNPGLSNGSVHKLHGSQSSLKSRTSLVAETTGNTQLLQQHVQRKADDQESTKLTESNTSYKRNKAAQENQSNPHIKQIQSKQSPASELMPSSCGLSNGDIVAYAKVNKSLKSEKSTQRRNPVSDVVTDESEPPLPPRNYRSDPFGKSCSTKSSLAERVQDLTRTAREALRKAFSMEWLNEKEGTSHPYGTKRKSGRNKNPSPIFANPKTVTTGTSGNKTPALQARNRSNSKNPPTTVAFMSSKMNSSNYTEIL